MRFIRRSDRTSDSPVPSGVLYAHVMSYMSLETYQRIVAALKREKLVTESAHELTWVGPPAPPVS